MFTLVMLAACGHNSGPGDSGPGNNETGTPPGTNPDVAFTLQAPEGVDGAMAYVSHQCQPSYDGECASGSVEDEQGENALPYVFDATIPTTYSFAFASATAESIDQSVTVTTDTENETVSWPTGGCADAGWSVESGWCNAWTSGAWSLAPSGMCQDKDGVEIQVTTSQVADITGDGTQDLEITLGGFSAPYYAAAGSYGINVNDDGFQAMIVIANDLSTITVYDTNGNSNELRCE